MKHGVIALALVVVCACGGGVDDAVARRDVLLVVIDTLRADYVGISGRAPYPATPEIDRLARRGRWFADAWACAPWTPPSVMSIMTSLEPAVHGLELEGHRLAETVPDLPTGASTIAEIFRSHGYRTLAVTAGGAVGAVNGFDRGFDRFFEPASRPPSDVASGVDRALRWLAEPDPRPTFLFFPTYEVHLPNTHEPFPCADDAASSARAAYAGDLAAADRHLGRLFAAFGNELGGRRSLVVVTSDHGENLHDRALGDRPVDHGHHLHAELLRVPLVIVAPGLVPPDGEVAGPASLLDVLPTVCSLVGIDLEGIPHQGRDLSASLTGSRPVAPLPALFASAPLQGPSWSAVRSGGWAYLRSPPIETDQWWGTVSMPEDTLYDRSSDPAERHNVAGDHPDVVVELRSTLVERRRAALELRRALGGGVDPGAAGVGSIEALRELGYVDRGPSTGE